MSMKVLSVVCARAGSKGLKNKCITKINGRMVVEYAIRYSLSLGNNVKTVVSTDIKALTDYCMKNSIVCIKRGLALCADESKIDDALMDAIVKEGKGCDYCSLVYGNIPTRYPKLFREGLAFLEGHKEYDAALSMQKVEKFHPEWMFEYNEKIIPRRVETSYRRQGLPPRMIHDGHTLIFRSGNFLKRYKGLSSYESKYAYSIFGDKIKPLLNDEMIADIDTEKDLKIARVILSKDQKGAL